MRRYAIWRDLARGCYEIVLWNEGVPAVVQTNILTKEKALRALDIWRQRGKAHGRQKSEN